MSRPSLLIGYMDRYVIKIINKSWSIKIKNAIIWLQGKSYFKIWHSGFSGVNDGWRKWEKLPAYTYGKRDAFLDSRIHALHSLHVPPIENRLYRASVISLNHSLLDFRDHLSDRLWPSSDGTWELLIP